MGVHLKNPVHFGEDKSIKVLLHKVDIKEAPLPDHFQVDEEVMTPQLRLLQLFHANMNENEWE